VKKESQGGFSLVEILLGLSIGLLLVAAFLATFDHCRTVFTTNASVASLQDTARHALSVLVPDLEHAGFFGRASASWRVTRAGVVIGEDSALWQPGASRVAVPVPGLPPGIHDCGTNFAVDLGLPVQMSNNQYARVAGGKCEPTAVAGGARAGSDTLTVRHASSETAPPRSGRVQVFTRRLASMHFGTVFGDGNPPGPLTEHTEVRDLEIRTYYIANHSVGRPGWPALRVKALNESAGTAQFRDEEILPGVEDLQVEFVLRNPLDGMTMRSFAPTTDQLREREVVAVRLWLRIRADGTERGFDDPRPLQYADVNFIPAGSESRMRRGVVERTVSLRNRRVP
jgi:hypothetical protein